MKQTNDKFDTPLQSNADVDTLDYKFNPVIRENMASYHSCFYFFPRVSVAKTFVSMPTLGKARNCSDQIGGE